MAFPEVIINRRTGGTGRQATSLDYKSGAMVYGTAPVVSGKWADFDGDPDIKTQLLFSIEDAESAGILPFTENTAPSGIYVISAVGATSDTVEMVIEVPKANGTIEIVSLGVYTILGSQTTIAQQGAAWAAVINLNTTTTGYSATFNTATLTVTAPKTVGLSLNSGTPISVTESSTFSGTITQFSGGTASQYSAWHYHIDEFFRKFPTGDLLFGIISSSDSFKELKTLQQASGNILRQVFVYDTNTTRASAANIKGTVLQIQGVLDGIENTAPMDVVYCPNIKAISDLSTYPDQNTNTAKRVQIVISQDGDQAGALLYVQNGQSIGHAGIKLSTIASSRVSASDAQPIPLFNISDGVENNLPAFSNGQISTTVSQNLQVQLDTYRYTFVRTFSDSTVGTYWTGNKTCITSSDDFCNINDTRTMDKAARIARSILIPQLNSELIFNTDGTLTDVTIAYFENLVTDAITANMITGFGSSPLISGVSTTIDPSQPVKQTGNLDIYVTIVQNGIARNITVNIGYGLSI